MFATAAQFPGQTLVAMPSGSLLGNRHDDRSQPIDRTLLRAATIAVELLALALLGLLIAMIHVEGATPFPGAGYAAAAVAGAAAFVAIADLMGLYRAQALAHPLQTLPRLLATWAGVLAALSIALFLAKLGPEFSRLWFALWLAGGAAVLLALRIVAAAEVGRWTRAGRIAERAVIYGAGEPTCELLARLEANPDSDLSILGIFDDRSIDRDAAISGYPRIGKLDELVDLVRSTRVDTIIVTLPVTAETRLSGIFAKLSVLPADIRLPALASRLRFSRQAYTSVGGLPMLAVFDKPISGPGLLAKAVFDKTIALLALIALAPVLAAVAIAVKLDSRGPVLFRQKRHGFNNQLVEVFKFRSMHTGSLDADAAKLVTRGDPRVTRVGRIIRKTSLDELPQLINVLTGDLSLVGPRPHALQAKAADRLYVDVAERYFARHKVKPGITGWAQINGWRGETDTEEKLRKRVEHDLWYIDNWSLLLDLYILARTPLALVRTESAY